MSDRQRQTPGADEHDPYAPPAVEPPPGAPDVRSAAPREPRGVAPDRGGRPPQPPEQRRPPEAVRRGAGSSLAAVALAVGSILLTGVTLVSALLGLALGVAAVVAAVRGRAAGRRAGMRVPGATGALVLAIVAAVLASMTTTVAVAFHQEFAAHAECSAGANTTTAQNDCDRALRDALEHRVPGLGQLLDRTG